MRLRRSYRREWGDRVTMRGEPKDLSSHGIVKLDVFNIDGGSRMRGGGKQKPTI